MRFAGLRIRPLLVLVVGLVFSLNQLAEANCKVLVLELSEESHASCRVAKTRVVYHLHCKQVSSWFGLMVTKFTTKFRPGIAFTICTIQFHLPKNEREALKLV